MGRSKEEWLESCERGYKSLGGKLVCIDCIKERYLRDLHLSHSKSGKCKFCSQTRVRVADAGIIQCQIMKSLLSDYENVEDAGVPFESAEGGWLIDHDPAREIVAENIAGIVSKEFGDAIVAAVDPNISLCERDWTILSPHARMIFAWHEFRATVKHQLRFSFAFLENDGDKNHPDYTHPALTLRELGHLVERLNLIRELDPGLPLYRVRLHKIRFFQTIEDLGSPPSTKASSNRMSPAGIPMLYAAEDIETAIKETWDNESPAVASIATFETTQPMRIIDFTRLPEPPSYWSNPCRGVLAEHRFLRDLAEELSEPVAPDSNVDLDYAPTQIVSEYLTKAWRGLPRSWSPPPELVHGISFRSSKTGRKNYGLNLLRDEHPNYGLLQTDFLELTQVEHRELSPP